MSLNGLDANAVVGAHQSALADAGGWFLLKYVSRDTVDVLSRGTGGVAEAKAAVAQYDEKSPLFGMVQYRRKRVVLKYVPEGTSRLLQVRLTVQFQSILDAFPHDTIFPFTVADELVESALGMCTMLQPTSAGSLQSSDSSTKQRRLNEITEDAEDVAVPMKKEEVASTPADNNHTMRASGGSSELSTLPPSAIRAKALLAKRKEEWEAESNFSSAMRPPRTDSRSPPPSLQPASALNDLVLSKVSNVDPPRPYTSLSHLRSREEFEPSEASHTLDPDAPEEPLRPSYHSRHLSENENDKISQWNEQVAAYTLPTPKPKKKLGPRIHVEPQVRPKTAGPYDDRPPTRQIANLPQTVRISSRPPTATISRPGSQQSSRSVPQRYVPPVGIPPPLPDQNPLRSLYKQAEGRKVGSALSVATDTSNVSPEKMRLMKALQQRKRTQILTQRAASAQPSLAIRHDDFPMHNYQSARLNPDSPVPATIPEEAAQSSGEDKSLHASSTASPTSVATTAENTSTRPSSFAEECDSQSSHRSISLDTDSSSTPKALADTNRNSSTQRAVMEAHANLVANGHPEPQDSAGPISISTEEVNRGATKSAETKSQGLLQTLKDADASSKVNDKRHLLAASLAIPAPSTEASSVFSDDDALIEELQSATVHEATPVSVVRPPSTPTAGKYSVSIRTITKSASTSSSPPKSTKSVPSVEEKSPVLSPRSLSTALPTMPSAPEEDIVAEPLTRKNTLGDGISKRIKALEVVTRRETVAPTVQSARETSATRATFTNLMKRTSFISQFQAPNATSEKPTSKDLSRSSQLPTPVGDNNTQSRPFAQRQVSATELYIQPQRGETISVTARIVREQDRPFTSTTEFYTNSNMALHRSPLVIEHARQDSEVSSPSTYYGAPLSGLPSPSLPSPMSDKKRFSFASHLSNSTVKFMHSDSMASRLSLSSNKRASRATPSETSSVHEDKRGSRASRLMKRVSGFGNRFGNKGQSPSIKDGYQPDAIMEHHEAFIRPGSVSDSVMQMIDIGYVNVQFPETLLWKRRFLQIDDQGYLIFTAPAEAVNTRSNNRKFHLADVQEPCLPDNERAEMAWSVLLDLRDGNCIQCACENKESQIQVLRMLLDAHSAYHSLYPGALE